MPHLLYFARAQHTKNTNHFTQKYKLQCVTQKKYQFKAFWQGNCLHTNLRKQQAAVLEADKLSCTRNILLQTLPHASLVFFYRSSHTRRKHLDQKSFCHLVQCCNYTTVQCDRVLDLCVWCYTCTIDPFESMFGAHFLLVSMLYTGARFVPRNCRSTTWQHCTPATQQHTHRIQLYFGAIKTELHH